MQRPEDRHAIYLAIRLAYQVYQVGITVDPEHGKRPPTRPGTLLK